MGEHCWAIIFALFRECNLQRRQDDTTEERDEEATKNDGYERYDEEHQIEKKNGY